MPGGCVEYAWDKHTVIPIEERELPGVPLRPQKKFPGYYQPSGQFCDTLIEDPKLAEGLPFVDQFQAEGWFAEKFKERYGASFTSRAPHAYDIVKVLAFAVRNQNGRVDGDSIVKGIEQLKEMPGAMGVIKLSPHRSIESECAYKVWKNGKMQPVRMEEITRSR